MTISETLAYGKRRLRDGGIESASLDAEVLLMHAVSFTRGELFTSGGMRLTAEESGSYAKLLDLRLSCMPVAYITNEREFMGLPFYVDKNVLIPRCDTETLVETAIGIIKEKDFTFGIEVGAGSGCISVSLAKFCPGLTMFGFDISSGAVGIANRNARGNGVEKYVYVHQADIFQMRSLNAYGELDFIISNPPYIPSLEIETLDAGVKAFEPHSALDGGADGLAFYGRICTLARQSLSAGGFLFFEIGYNQAEAVSDIMERHGFGNITVLRDLAGLDRVVYGTLKGDQYA